jgi:hypothetical protein
MSLITTMDTMDTKERIGVLPDGFVSFVVEIVYVEILRTLRVLRLA